LTERKPVSEDVRERLPRLILDFIAIILTLAVAYVVLPIANAISFIVPAVGISIGLMVAVIFLVILAILVVRVLHNTGSLVNLSSETLSKAVPGLEEPYVNLFRKVTRDFFFAVVILILFYVVTPFIVLIPGVGVSLAAAIPLVLGATIVILLYDAGRLLYSETTKVIDQVAEKVASLVEE
jgi:hypothetical protein